VSGAVENGGQVGPIVVSMKVRAHDKVDLKINNGGDRNASCDTTQVDLTATLYPS
jgi:hypothetical protein